MRRIGYRPGYRIRHGGQILRGKLNLGSNARGACCHCDGWAHSADGERDARPHGQP